MAATQRALNTFLGGEKFTPGGTIDSSRTKILQFEAVGDPLSVAKLAKHGIALQNDKDNWPHPILRDTL